MTGPAVRFSLRQLRYILAAAGHGSIKAAAAEIRVSEAAISAAIGEVERTYGVQLFVRRHAQGLSPSPAGRDFLQGARAVLAQAEDLDRAARGLREDVGGRLEVGFLVTLAPLLAPPLARAFLDRHREVELRLVEGHQDELLTRLRGGELDLAITYDMQLDAEMRFDPLVPLGPCALLPPDHRFAAGPRAPLRELAAEPLVLLDLPLSRDYFLSLFTHLGLRPRVAQRSGHPEVVRGLVAHGFGYALFNILPRGRVALDGMPFAVVPLAEPVPELRLGVVQAIQRHRTGAAQAFLAFARERVDHAFLGLDGG